MWSGHTVRSEMMMCAPICWRLRQRSSGERSTCAWEGGPVECDIRAGGVCATRPQALQALRRRAKRGRVHARSAGCARAIREMSAFGQTTFR